MSEIKRSVELDGTRVLQQREQRGGPHRISFRVQEGKIEVKRGVEIVAGSPYFSEEVFIYTRDAEDDDWQLTFPSTGAVMARYSNEIAEEAAGRPYEFALPLAWEAFLYACGLAEGEVELLLNLNLTPKWL